MITKTNMAVIAIGAVACMAFFDWLTVVDEEAVIANFIEEQKGFERLHLLLLYAAISSESLVLYTERMESGEAACLADRSRCWPADIGEVSGSLMRNWGISAFENNEIRNTWGFEFGFTRYQDSLEVRSVTPDWMVVEEIAPIFVELPPDYFTIEETEDGDTVLVLALPAPHVLRAERGERNSAE